MTDHCSLRWQPTASLAAIRARARLYATIRHFFAARNVLEVETPILSAAAVPEPAITPFFTHYHAPHASVKTLFLHTSPELPMKRLLAAEIGAIYQITKVFRDGEQGSRHNPEFTLLEWYHPHWNQYELLQEIDDLLQLILNCPPAETLSYKNAFFQYLKCCPVSTPLHELQKMAENKGYYQAQNLSRSACLQFLMSQHIEPFLGEKCPLFLVDFPTEQAALARKKEDDPQYAARFEVYYRGIELANGFEELTDPKEQRERFLADLATRQQQQQPLLPLDERFLMALQAGLPACSGVALGLDRLLMLQLGVDHIHDVLTFPIDEA
jgi:elongation factor P--(R)-beta-lysine ligase